MDLPLPDSPTIPSVWPRTQRDGDLVQRHDHLALGPLGDRPQPAPQDERLADIGQLERPGAELIGGRCRARMQAARCEGSPL